MALLLDTQILVWIGADDPRISSAVRAQIEDVAVDIFVSAVTAFEFADLQRRGRFRVAAGLGSLLQRVEATVMPFPAEAWRLVAALPDLHRDPADRMLIAHAIHSDLTLATADRIMRQYPVRCLW